MTGLAVSSIHRRVLVWVMAALIVGATLLVASTYLSMKNELGEVFEDSLKQVALTVANHHSEYGISRKPRLVDQLPRIYEEYGEFDFVTAAWSLGGTLTHTSDAKVALPFLSRSGLSRVYIGGNQWHLYTIVLEDGIVQAAQRDSARQALSRESSFKLVLPAIAMLAILAMLLTLALKRGLAPLSLAAAEVTARSVETLHPIALATQPAELHLLVGAINDLMTRLGSALALQRHFLADAAHELRTPITALKLQLQLLERANDAGQREAARNELRAGIERAQHLIEQLLQLSRLAPETPALRREPVDLAGLVRSTVSVFSARADEQLIDLGAVVEGEPVVNADAQQLAILLNNLVDNALRHTPPRGRIDVGVSLRDGKPCITVIDSGCGIQESERARVFDRFYRVPSARSLAPADGCANVPQPSGSGLGLAIVQAVAERHGAEVFLDQSVQGGLRVSVQFPESWTPA